jgi:hypothetical protein
MVMRFGERNWFHNVAAWQGKKGMEWKILRTTREYVWVVHVCAVCALMR